MLRTASIGLAVCGSLLFPGAARADHFAIDLKVSVRAGTKTAHADTAAIGVQPKPRGVVDVRAGEKIAVAWTLRSSDAKNTYNDVLVHFFVVREEKAGQQAVPPLDKSVAAESALTMDFKPGDRADATLEFTLESPGSYLLRLETIGAAVGSDGHEHFAAMDLVVR
jgi:hypothetical protein